MIPLRQRLIDYHGVDEALNDLCNGFSAPEPAAWRDVAPDDIPPPFHRLLVHHEHMTARLADHYAQAVELRVLRQRLDDKLYHRQIVLTLPGADTVVECGIVRIDLSYTPDALRAEILSGEAPLGDILIRHRVLRRIQPQWYLRLPGRSPFLDTFGCDVPTDVFGRVATIFCNDQPAIELLEVVTAASPVP